MPSFEKISPDWFGRIGSAFGGMNFGLLVFLLGTALLWWNEGDVADADAALLEAQSLTRELIDINKPDASLNGQLVHAVGFADTPEMLTDPFFKISARAISLSRKVEFHQWTEESGTETRAKSGGGTESVVSHSYRKKWVSAPVDSTRFKDEAARSYNAGGVLLPLEDYEAKAVEVNFGVYRLPAFLIQSIRGYMPLDAALSEAARVELTRRLAAAGRPASREASAELEYVHIQGNGIYLGASPAVPQVGDMRVTFRTIKPAHVSIIARVNGDTFEPFRAAGGKSIGMLSMGTLSMDNMYGAAREGGSFSTWALRFLGGFLIVAGLGMTLAPLSLAIACIPVLGALIGAGVGMVCLLLGTAWSLAVISIAWLSFRPLIGGVMLALAGALIALRHVRGRARKAAAAQAQASALQG